MTYVVVVADRIADSGFALLNAEEAIEVVSTAGDAARLKEEIKRANALIVRSDTKVTADLMAKATELQVIGRAGVGVDNVDVAAATQRGIAVLNAPGANTVSAAEHAIGLLLASLRNIPPAVSSMRAGKWARKEFPGTEMRGKTLGLVGLGRIGRHVATIARAFGMRIIAHDPYLPEARALELGIELVPVDQLLSRADVVSLHLPLTDDTRHFLNRERIAQMKDGAVVVNTARGALIDDTALIEALDSGKLGGAALDVFEPEPLVEDSPLRSHERVTLTPHLAASTSEAQERVATEICTAIRDALLTGSVGGAVNLPGISGEALARLVGVMEVARRIGRLAAAIANGRIQSVAVVYGGNDEDAPRPVMLAALEGVLSAMGVDQVSIVNAAALADERGMRVSRKVTTALSGFSTTIGVKVQGQHGITNVIGAIAGELAGRVIEVNGFDVDVPADGYVLVLRNRDVPGVIGRVGTVLGKAEINIASYHQSRGGAESHEALATIVVDRLPASAVVAQLTGLADVLEVTVANLNGGQSGD